MAKKRLLLVFDLNGTILYRHSHSSLSTTLEKCGNANGRAIYARPHLEELVRATFSAFDVAVWTSAEEQNAIPMVDSLKSFGFLRENLKFLWSRSRCKVVPRTSEEIKRAQEEKNTPSLYVKPVALKDLACLWKEMPEYSEENTLIIDDSLEKICQPQNSIVISGFSANSPRAEDDSALLLLSERLKQIDLLVAKGASLKDALLETGKN